MFVAGARLLDQLACRVARRPRPRALPGSRARRARDEISIAASAQRRAPIGVAVCELDRSRTSACTRHASSPAPSASDKTRRHRPPSLAAPRDSLLEPVDRGEHRTVTSSAGTRRGGHQRGEAQEVKAFLAQPARCFARTCGHCFARGHWAAHPAVRGQPLQPILTRLSERLEKAAERLIAQRGGRDVQRERVMTKLGGDRIRVFQFVLAFGVGVASSGVRAPRSRAARADRCDGQARRIPGCAS